MTVYVPDMDDVNSLISLSSSTLCSNQGGDADSNSDSQDLHDVDRTDQLEQQQSINYTQDAQETQKNKNDMNFQSESTAQLKPDAGAAVACNAENQESEELTDGKTEEYPFLKSVKYLEQHSILRLFQNLAADIVYHRPDQPLKYIVEKLEKQRREENGENKEVDLEV